MNKINKLYDISCIKNIMIKHGFKISKGLGQNFIISPEVCPRMAIECSESRDIGMIEIGPGIGVLTVELAKRFSKVVSIEIDERLIPILKENLLEFDNVKIINNDIMDIDIQGLISTEFPGMDVCICANLPYYITSPIIMKLLESELQIKSLTVMIQREAAQRICAEPGSKECGAISVAVRYYSEPRILFEVPRENFLPVPNVDSSVIRMDINSEKKSTVKDKETFFRIVKAAFAQRRKTVLNSLCNSMGYDKEHIGKIMEQINISPNVRAERLSFENFVDISNIISRI